MDGTVGTKKPYRRGRRGRGEEIEAGVKLSASSAFSAVRFVLSSEKVRAFEVDPAPLKISRGFSKARGARQGRAFEERSAPLNFSGKKGINRGRSSERLGRIERRLGRVTLAERSPSPPAPLPRWERGEWCRKGGIRGSAAEWRASSTSSRNSRGIVTFSKSHLRRIFGRTFSQLRAQVRPVFDAERRDARSHAERGNEGVNDAQLPGVHRRCGRVRVLWQFAN